MKQRTRYLVGVTTAIALSFIVHPEAQRRAPGEAPPKQGIQASLKAGSDTYDSKAAGKCTHAAMASIYEVVSQMWSVQQSADGRSLTLTVWRPKDGSGDMVNLSIDTGKSSHKVSTVRGGGPVQGTAKVTLEKSAAGGTFTLDARAQDGTTITGTIKCDVFGPHIAAGGL